MINGHVKMGDLTVPVTQYPIGNTHVNLVAFGASEGRDLLDQFRLCPHAEALLARIASSVSVTLWPRPENEIPKTVYIDKNPVIFMFPSKKPMETLVFELINADKGFDNTLAKNGHQGIDDYAKQLILEEYDSELQRNAMANICSKHWGYNPTPSQTVTQEFFALARELDCTADIYRGEWRKKYKDVFCRNHPKDKEYVQPRSLCDRVRFPVGESGKQQFCRLSDSASPTTQEERKNTLQGGAESFDCLP